MAFSQCLLYSIASFIFEPAAIEEWETSKVIVQPASCVAAKLYVPKLKSFLQHNTNGPIKYMNT